MTRHLAHIALRTSTNKETTLVQNSVQEDPLNALYKRMGLVARLVDDSEIESRTSSTRGRHWCSLDLHNLSVR
jgi:hypothetical protein